MKKYLETLFVLNAVILCAHQIDAAYWHEWELFHIPGGNQLNLLLNVPLLASVFYAYRQVALATDNWRLAQIYLASLGLLTVSLHSAFFALDYVQFLQPVSIILILATGLLSVAQIVLVLRTSAD